MTLTQAATKFRSQARMLRNGRATAKQKAADATYRFALNRSSGQYTTATLRIMGHPYGFGLSDFRGKARSTIPYSNAGIINSQSGLFKASWQVFITPTGFVIRNDAPYAGYLVEGTPFMQKRPIDLEIIAYARSEWFAQVSTLFNRVSTK